MMDDVRHPLPKKPKPTPKPASETETTDEPPFRPPETVAAEDEAKAAALVASARLAARRVQEKVNHHWNNSRKAFIAVVVAVLVLAGGATFWAVKMHRRAPVASIPKTTPIVKPKPVVPTTVPSALTGLPVDPSINNRPVTGIMIENSTDARPQSGLSQAGVVFEAIAEGGITRFLTLYQDQWPSNVGPIRSARPYYLQWDLGFDAPLAHVGGSPEALSDIKSWGVKDLDQFANGGSYQRVSNRPAPHNVYTSLETLNQLETKKGFTSSTFTGFARKKDSPAKQPNAVSVDFAISSGLYNVHYDYDAAGNAYKRSEGGAAHVDANTGAQLEPKVVIALVIPYNLEADNKHSQYGIVGSGKAFIFQDGTVTVGSWSKLSQSAQITFSDANNQPLSLNAGQTWLSAVSDASKVSYR